MTPAPTMKTIKTLILVGGGHTHALLMHAFIDTPPKNLKILLVSPSILTPYSGMLPGLIAGHYLEQEIHINLASLSNQLNAHLLLTTATALNPKEKELTLANGNTLNYDLISFDTGATPALPYAVRQSTLESNIAVKPIDKFYSRWQRLLSQLSNPVSTKTLAHHTQSKPNPTVISVIGSGAAGIELALSIAHAVKSSDQRSEKEFKIQVVSNNNELLPHYPRKVIKKIKNALEAHCIRTIFDTQVVDTTDQSIVSSEGVYIKSDYHLWCTSVEGAAWLKDCQLALSDTGFIRVRPTLQTLGYDDIFAVGDVCHFDPHPLPKAGVYAVRMAKTLERNLIALLEKHQENDQHFTQFKPQQDFLSLLACGGKFAVGSKWGVTISGRWVWQLKNRIDRNFMNQFVNKTGS